MNKVILLGRLGKDPELKYLPSGSAVCEFSIATSEVWTDKNGTKQESVEWHNIVVWDREAELCSRYLAKGRQVSLEGRLKTRNWKDKDGKTCYKTEVQATQVYFVGNNPAQSPSKIEEKTKQEEFASEDVPF